MYIPSSTLSWLATSQISSALMSFLASTLVATMVAWPRNGGLTTPYRRIIFGLSSSDIIQSFSLLIGPWAVPSWAMVRPGLWGTSASESNWHDEDNRRSNSSFCKADGFILIVGVAAVPTYSLLLCIYYLCKLKYRMTDEDFYRRIEKRMHIVIIISSILLGCIVLWMDVIYPNSVGLLCYIEPVPQGCRYNREVVGECEENVENRIKILSLVLVLLSGMTLVGIISITISIYLQSKDWNKRPNSNQEAQQTTGDPTNNRSESYQLLSRLYRRETAISVCLYSGSFLLAYVPTMILISITSLSTKRVPIYLYFWASVVFPGGGVVNVLIFTRPQVVSLRRRKPHYSRIRAFWIVVRNGGEAPNEADGDATRKKNPGNSIVKSDQEGNTSSVPFGVLVNQMSSSSMLSSSPYGASAAAVDGESISFGNSHAQFRKSSERECVSEGNVFAQHGELSGGTLSSQPVTASEGDDCSGPLTDNLPPLLTHDAGICIDDDENDLSVEVEEDRDRDIWEHAFSRIRKMGSVVISIFSGGSDSSGDSYGDSSGDGDSSGP